MIHLFQKRNGFSLESQIRDLAMELQCENPIIDTENDESNKEGNFSPLTTHDKYKKDKMKKWYENPILRHILEQDEYAFDSSTEVLEESLYNPNVELSSLLGKYIFVTKVANGKSKPYIPTINEIFEHTFRGNNNPIHDPSDPYPLLDFSSFKKYVESKKKRYDAINIGNSDLGLDITDD